MVGRRAAGSKGLDTVVYKGGEASKGFDLKTGRGWAASELKALAERFSIPIQEVKTR